MYYLALGGAYFGGYCKPKRLGLDIDVGKRKLPLAWMLAPG